MKTSLYYLSFFFLMTASYSKSLKEMDWGLVSNDEDIFIYRPKTDGHASGISPTKFHTILKENIRRVLSVLSDTKRKTQWVPSLLHAEIVEFTSRLQKIEYYRYDTPWPFKQRTFLVESSGTYDPKSMTIEVQMRSVKRKKHPQSPDYVRAVTYEGYSIIRPSQDGLGTYVEMGLINDFKGHIPHWLINRVQVKWPYRFLKNLKKQLARKDVSIFPRFKEN